MYNSRILKSRYVSVVEPVSINTAATDDFNDYKEDEETEEIDDEAEKIDNEEVAAEIIANANKEAEEIIERSKREAEEFLQKKKEEADLYKEEVARKAYEEAYSKGYDEGKVAFNVAMEAIQEESQKLNDSYKELLNNSESQIVQLILEIAQKVINEDVKLNRDNMILLVKKALDICYEKQSASIKISTKDYEYLNEKVPDLMEQINAYENISIKRDASLKDGDCVVDTPFGTVDMGVDKCLDKISDTFMQEVS